MVDSGIQRSHDGPIPGQSLTQKMGNRPYEKPPMFNDPDKAMGFMFKQMTQPDQAVKVVGMLKQGVPVTAIVSTLLMHGFSEGKWTPDVALMLAGPLAVLIRKIGQLAKVDNIKTGAEKPAVDPVFMHLASDSEDKTDASSAVALVKDAEAEVKPELQNIRKGGLGSPKGV